MSLQTCVHRRQKKRRQAKHRRHGFRASGIGFPASHEFRHVEHAAHRIAARAKPRLPIAKPHGVAAIFPEGEGIERRIEFELTIDDPEVTDETVGDIEQEARAILEDGVQSIVDMAQTLARVRTGAWRASIYGEVEDVTGIVVGATVSYAGYQEYGTSKMPAYSFLGAAIDEYEPAIQEELDQMIAEHLAEHSSEDNREFRIERTTEQQSEKE